MKFPDLDYFSISDRLRAHAWWLFFDPDRARYEELRQRSNERLHEYYSFDELFIEPLSRPGFANSTVFGFCLRAEREQDSPGDRI
jgi:hypothetical protein